MHDYCINFPIVDEKLESSVFLRDEFYRCGPFCSRGLDDIFGEQHIILEFFQTRAFSDQLGKMPSVLALSLVVIAQCGILPL